MTHLLCPADVCERFKCGIRKAYKVMRDAGATPFGSSLRIEPEKLESWWQKQTALASTNEVASGTRATLSASATCQRAAPTLRLLRSGAQPASVLQPIRQPKPRKRPRSETSAAG